MTEFLRIFGIRIVFQDQTYVSSALYNVEIFVESWLNEEKTGV